LSLFTPLGVRTYVIMIRSDLMVVVRGTARELTHLAITRMTAYFQARTTYV